jgi:hypothetical protein
MSLRCSADTPVLPPNIRFQGQVGYDAMLLMAQSGHPILHCQCALLGVKQTT